MASRLKTFVANHLRLVALLSVVVVSSLVFTLVADRSPIRVRAVSWAASHAESLPQTIEDLAAYPPEYRREIMKALPPETQSAIWRAQLRKFADDRPHLTAEQRAFVAYAIEVSSPAAFQPGATPPELCERIAKLFPNAEDRRLFTKIAENVTPRFALRPAMITLAERFRARVFTSARAPECSCRGLGFCECSIFEVCESTACRPTDDCGCIFLGRCDRVCESVIDPLATRTKK